MGCLKYRQCRISPVSTKIPHNSGTGIIRVHLLHKQWWGSGAGIIKSLRLRGRYIWLWRRRNALKRSRNNWDARMKGCWCWKPWKKPDKKKLVKNWKVWWQRRQGGSKRTRERGKSLSRGNMRMQMWGLLAMGSVILADWVPKNLVYRLAKSHNNDRSFYRSLTINISVNI